MAQPLRIKIEESVIENIRLRFIESDCPKCDAVLIHNHSEQCYECLNCGYIDCGDEVQNNKQKTLSGNCDYISFL